MDLSNIDPKQLEKLASKLDISIEKLSTMSVEELAELLSNRAKHEFGELADEQLAKVAGGEGILDDLDPVLLELLRQRPQF